MKLWIRWSLVERGCPYGGAGKGVLRASGERIAAEEFRTRRQGHERIVRR
jgi:hypothetical protein